MTPVVFRNETKQIKFRRGRSLLGTSVLCLFFSSEKTIRNAVDRGEIITGKNVIKLTSEGMFWANTMGAEMAVEYLYKGKGELVSLEEKTSKIAK